MYTFLCTYSLCIQLYDDWQFDMIESDRSFSAKDPPVLLLPFLPWMYKNPLGE